MTVFLIIWLSCGAVVIAIAVWKKLNVLKWAFLGPVFGFVALLLVLAEAGARSGVWSADGSTYYGSGYSGSGCGGGGGNDGGCSGSGGCSGGCGGGCGGGG